MKSFLSKYSLFLLLLFAVACKKNEPVSSSITETKIQNSIRYAKGFEIYKHEGFSIVKVSNPWPEANKTFTYVLHKKGVSLPDSLKNYTSLQVPIKSIVVTSTTHIPSLEMLGVENTLLGFPDTNLVSSEKTRKLIDAGKVTEIGANQSLNTERLIDLDPEALVGYSSGSDTKTYDNLQKSGLKVFFNGDWMEESPLGKAEWIKFFGALYGLDEKADLLFSEVETAYKEATELAKNAKTKPTVLSGAIYKEQWYMPRGNSWAATFLKDANAAYLWADTEGTGSLALSFETVMEKAENVDFWIGPAQFTTFKEMVESNPNYAHFKAFKNKNIYSFSSKKGKTGGILYYELASNRPDLILKDLIKILHPELLTEYELYIFEKLK
ncbi:iron complex transport system substrate-binding protein [Flavobacterium sp. 28YEA47A]|uniref:ABC transporter substrate-binding protein n=1 Tax=Flavobacterium sp. 28YEA47A TaxID=3156276 RepID=UPI0035164F48